jgi:hypothetical protein
VIDALGFDDCRPSASKQDASKCIKRDLLCIEHLGDRKDCLGALTSPLAEAWQASKRPENGIRGELFRSGIDAGGEGKLIDDTLGDGTAYSACNECLDRPLAAISPNLGRNLVVVLARLCLAGIGDELVPRCVPIGMGGEFQALAEGLLDRKLIELLAKQLGDGLRARRGDEMMCHGNLRV